MQRINTVETYKNGTIIKEYISQLYCEGIIISVTYLNDNNDNPAYVKYRLGTEIRCETWYQNGKIYKI